MLIKNHEQLGYRFAVSFRRISRLVSIFVFLLWIKFAHIYSIFK